MYRYRERNHSLDQFCIPHENMLELVPVSITFVSLAKVILILGINVLLGYTWYSPYAFQKPWLQAMQWQEGDEHSKKALLMSNIATLFNSFLLHILLIALDIRKQQWISAILASAILTGFYAVSVRCFPTFVEGEF